MNPRFVSILAAGLLAALSLNACSDPPAQVAPPTRARPRADADGGAAPAGDGGTESDAAGPHMQLTDNDFTEGDRTRDPFRSFLDQFRPAASVAPMPQIESKLSQYSLDELRLVAVITATDRPYAMVIPPSGNGTIIRPGDFVGRPEAVAGGEASTRVPWRVARIVGSRISRDRNNDLVEVPGQVLFDREDRSNPNGPSRSERSLNLNPVAAQALEDSAAASPAVPNPGMGAPLGSVPSGGSPYLPSLPGAPQAPGSPFRPGAPGSPQAPGSTQAPTFVQNYTQVIPPQQVQAPVAPTVVIQNTQAPAQPSTPQPVQLPSGPPPVQINDQPTRQDPAMPLSGLPPH